MNKLKAGDRVRWEGHTGTIIHINGLETQTRWDKDKVFSGEELHHDLDLSKEFIKISPKKPTTLKDVMEAEIKKLI